MILLEDATGRRIDPEYLAVLAKTMIVHSARMPRTADEVRAAFGEMSDDK